MARTSKIKLDRRQTLAATILMSAVDLPQPMPEIAELWIAAARLTPGCTVEEACAGMARPDALRQARRLVDELIAETEGEAAHG